MMRSGAGGSGVRSGGHALWAILIVVLAFAGIAHWLDDPPAPLALDAPAVSFSAQRAAAELRTLLAEGVPHPLASNADAQVRTRILARLAALGIPAELQSGWVCDQSFACGLAVNIVARLDGSEPASGAVLLAAHYDSVPAGPGAGDDGVGVASILEIARILKQQPAARHPVILLIDEGEETGLLGAKLFVDSHPQARTVKAVVNLEARGDSGPSLMFETGAATDFSMRLFASAVARPKSNSLYYFIYKLLPNDTDFTVFKAAGYEGFNFALIGNVERYHTPQDNLANLDLGSLQHQGQNALQAVQALANADLSHPSAAGAVFFDLFGRVLLHWPASWAPWIGIVLIAALVAALWPLRRRAGASAQEIVYSLAALLIGWAGTVLAAAVLVMLVRASGAVPPAEAYGWAAHPLGMHIACVALALLAPLAAVRLFARRTSAWGLWLANVKLQAALALLCSLGVSGAELPVHRAGGGGSDRRVAGVARTRSFARPHCAAGAGGGIARMRRRFHAVAFRADDLCGARRGRLADHHGGVWPDRGRTRAAPGRHARAQLPRLPVAEHFRGRRRRPGHGIAGRIFRGYAAAHAAVVCARRRQRSGALDPAAGFKAQRTAARLRCRARAAREVVAAGSRGRRQQHARAATRLRAAATRSCLAPRRARAAMPGTCGCARRAAPRNWNWRSRVM